MRAAIQQIWGVGSRYPKDDRALCFYVKVGSFKHPRCRGYQGIDERWRFNFMFPKFVPETVPARITILPEA